MRYGNGPQNNINIQTMLMNLNLVLIILMIKNSLSVYGFYERRLNMRGTRFIKTNGRNVRADCSGMVSAILVQAGFLKPIRLSCSTYSYEYDRRDTWDDSVVYEMEIAGFVWHPIDTAAFSIMTEEQLEDYLQNGDIMLSSSHIEIFDCVFYENNIPFLSYYSWGRAYPAEPAVSRYDTISIHYIEYEGFWRYEG